MLKVGYKPAFVRELKKLEDSLIEEVLGKIEQFKDVKNHQSLKVHKLHGRLASQFSFSVNYKIRIIFEYESKDEVALLAIGDHDVYKS